MYRIRILVNNKPIPQYHDRFGNTWIEARYGQDYSIKVENNDFRRVLAVISVDGLNVINGTHEDPDISPGYIINGNSSITIPGWLVDSNTVRSFYFENPNNTYASKTGSDMRNIGVIGCALFEEQRPHFRVTTSSTFPYYTDWSNWSDKNKWNERNEITPYMASAEHNDAGPYYSYSNEVYSSSIRNTSFSKSSSDQQIPSQQVGTGSGRKQQFSTQEENFYRGAKHLLTLFYDTRDNLVDKGIIVEKPQPRPFPISYGYCPDV